MREYLERTKEEHEVMWSTVFRPFHVGRPSSHRLYPFGESNEWADIVTAHWTER